MNRFLKKVIGLLFLAKKIYNTLLFQRFRSNSLVINSWIELYGDSIKHNNWGDDINFLFIREIVTQRIFNIHNLYKTSSLKDLDNYLLIGSIIESFSTEKSSIWGSGAMFGNVPLKIKPKRVYAVRGPLTRNYLLNNGVDCPPIYGDPALLLPYHYQPCVEKCYKIGLIPHYVDYDNDVIKKIVEKYPNDVVLINMQSYSHWHDVVDIINQCEMILSSSLHGLIVSDSYSVPNVWISLSDKIRGGNFKYLDYFQSVNRNTVSPKKIIAGKNYTLEDLYHWKNEWKQISFNPKPLIDSCPFDISLKYYHS